MSLATRSESLSQKFTVFLNLKITLLLFLVKNSLYFFFGVGDFSGFYRVLCVCMHLQDRIGVGLV